MSKKARKIGKSVKNFHTIQGGQKDGYKDSRLDKSKKWHPLGEEIENSRDKNISKPLNLAQKVKLS